VLSADNPPASIYTKDYGSGARRNVLDAETSLAAVLPFFCDFLYRCVIVQVLVGKKEEFVKSNA